MQSWSMDFSLVAIGDIPGTLGKVRTFGRGYPILTEKEKTMKTKYAILAATVLVLGMGASGAALADRAPTGEELAKIETALKGMGYTTWESIEMDDDQTVWEVDDAKLADGTEHDLKLATESLAVVEKDPE